MPSHVCSNCKRYSFYSTRVSFLHTCQACFRTFCKQCAATYFLCKNCEANLPAGVFDDLVAKMKQPKKSMETTQGMTTIGAILLPTTALMALILSVTHAYYLFFLLIIQPVSGIVLLITGAVMRYNSRMGMRQIANSILHPYARSNQFGGWQPSPGWQQQSVQPQYQPVQPQYQPMQPIEPPAMSPAIPSSAFVPVVNEIPYQPPRAAKKTRTVPAGYVDAASVATNAQVASGGSKEFCGMCGAVMPNISDLKFCPGCGAPRE